ncbi:MAG: chemotaxis response regulator protein-glutamate methylesterase [Betaproteobacteria bacterium]|nr:chemotaxis response regulator protein-glutamate methylesterase [Betaproteobacteria bacterium]
MKIRVLIVDDSALIRGIIAAYINEQPDMTVVGEAPDPIVARDLIASLKPDVLTLDIEMPNMNGLSFLKRLMAVKPMPVVMLSSYTQDGSDIAFRALDMGAVDFIPKPTQQGGGGIDYGRVIGEKIRAAHSARDKLKSPDAVELAEAQEVLPMLAHADNADQACICIGGATGGADALKTILPRLPAAFPPVVVALDVPASFAAILARKMGAICQVKVKEAEHGEPLLPGHCYLAPGARHIAVEHRKGRGLFVQLADSAPVMDHRPSADVLFHSAAALGEHAIGIVLSGWGDDGAAGLKAMRKAGAYTIAQDEATSIVSAMPHAAINADAAEEVLPVERMPDALFDHLNAVLLQEFEW